MQKRRRGTLFFYLNLFSDVITFPDEKILRLTSITNNHCGRQRVSLFYRNMPDLFVSLKDINAKVIVLGFHASSRRINGTQH